MTEDLLPRFITSREVDPLLGSRRTRERWEQEGLLPSGELVSGYRSAVRIFPDFAVARLAAPRTLERSKTLYYRLNQINRGLYRSPVFAELREALKEVLSPGKSLGAAELANALLPTHRDLLQRFAAAVRDAEKRLAELDVDVEVELGSVSHGEYGFYVVKLSGGGERQVSRSAAPRSCRLKPGQWVTIEDAKVRGFQREFIFPTAVLDEAEAASMIVGTRPRRAAEPLGDVLADRPAPAENLTGGRRSPSVTDQIRAGRIGVIDTEPVLTPTSKSAVSGLSYPEPAFRAQR